MDFGEAISLMSKELVSAQTSFPSFNTPHEGYAVILEEVDELWDEIKDNLHYSQKDRMAKEAVQVAAMALRFLIDLC